MLRSRGELQITQANARHSPQSDVVLLPRTHAASSLRTLPLGNSPQRPPSSDSGAGRFDRCLSGAKWFSIESDLPRSRAGLYYSGRYLKGTFDRATMSSNGPFD